MASFISDKEAIISELVSEAYSILELEGIRLVAFDFDETLVKTHVDATTYESCDTKTIYNEFFMALIHRIQQQGIIKVAIVTFNKKTIINDILSTLDFTLKEKFNIDRSQIKVITIDDVDPKIGIFKSQYMEKAQQHFNDQTGSTITHQTSLLIDDNYANVLCYREICKGKAVQYGDKPPENRDELNFIIRGVITTPLTTQLKRFQTIINAGSEYNSCLVKKNPKKLRRHYSDPTNGSVSSSRADDDRFNASVFGFISPIKQGYHGTVAAAAAQSYHSPVAAASVAAAAQSYHSPVAQTYHNPVAQSYRSPDATTAKGNFFHYSNAAAATDHGSYSPENQVNDSQVMQFRSAFDISPENSKNDQSPFKRQNVSSSSSSSSSLLHMPPTSLNATSFQPSLPPSPSPRQPHPPSPRQPPPSSLSHHQQPPSFLPLTLTSPDSSSLPPDPSSFPPDPPDPSSLPPPLSSLSHQQPPTPPLSPPLFLSLNLTSPDPSSLPPPPSSLKPKNKKGGRKRTIRRHWWWWFNRSSGNKKAWSMAAAAAATRRRRQQSRRHALRKRIQKKVSSY